MADYPTYKRLYIDLGTARTNKEVDLRGDFLIVQQLDGELTLKINNPQHDPIDLRKLRRFKNTPYNKFYLTNTVQTGKVAILHVGKTEMFAPDISLAHMYHDAVDAVLFTSESLNLGDLLTHYQIETNGYNTLMILASTTAQTTWYPQFSPDDTDWYDYCDSAGTPIQYTVNNAKKAIAINDCQAKYFRVVVYANAAAIVNGDLSVQA